MKQLKQCCYIILFWLIFFVSCNSQTNYKSPEGYDLNNPVKVFLETNLNEISGINYYPKDTGIFAISDATGNLYKIFPGRKMLVQKWRFGSNHDYEDLQLQDSIFYVLASSGDIMRIKFISANSLQTTKYNFPEKKDEFETLYFDSSLNKLIMICKDCKDDKKKEVSTFTFDPITLKYSEGPYKIDADKIASLLRTDKIKFKPSAAAINPLTHQLFVLSSVNKCIAVMDKNGKVQSVYPLSSSVYKQPEGIAFTPKGDLLISNEYDNNGSANILIITFKQKPG